MTSIRWFRAASAVVLYSTFTSAVQAPTVRLTAVLEKDAIVFHEPVYINVTVTNDLNEQVLGALRSDTFQFLISDQTGPPVRITQPRSSRELTGGISPDGNHDIAWKIGLKPLETFRIKILLNEYYSFPRPGNYKIEVRTPTNLTLRSGRPVMVQTSLLSLQIENRDETRLFAIASALTANALSSSQPPETRNTDARTLSYIEDPLAIPFFRRVLEESIDSQTRIYMIEGLGRVQNREAVDVLVASLTNRNSSVRSYARAILRQREATTSDQVMKQRIREALGQ